ncbi:ribokinase [Chroococcidiopsis thermalis]|uniref:Ribokinase n=1 Tax=Chroococcidiopsis thermalis (strain PCC 7203) TaxID=251229 RepID=K9U702_CHRTP|nr:ribokinase [Chroococcidiopsis thermalis]AFY90892.1 ribokinase [Chroococcidiopsis thermalis PCC 7203]
MNSIIVFGSINIDLVSKTPRLPLPGETLTGHSFVTAPGGKGANQAVAIAKLGVPSYMVGRVGGDNFGRELLASLQAAGVRTENVLVDESISSGVAAIAVDDNGENQIIITPGANGRVDETDVERLQSVLKILSRPPSQRKGTNSPPSQGGLGGSRPPSQGELEKSISPPSQGGLGGSILLLQLEIPLSAVITAAQVAKAAGIQVILDPAPAQNLPDELYPLIDIITPNETEAGRLVGFTVDGRETATEAARALLQKGVGNAIVKLGAKGVICATQAETFFTPAFSVTAVDTVAAGDAFNGGLAAALVEGLPLRQAVVWGAAAGALAATKPGAQSAMCDRPTLEALMATGS